MASRKGCEGVGGISYLLVSAITIFYESMNHD